MHKTALVSITGPADKPKEKQPYAAFQVQHLILTVSFYIYRKAVDGTDFTGVSCSNKKQEQQSATHLQRNMMMFQLPAKSTVAQPSLREGWWIRRCKSKQCK